MAVLHGQINVYAEYAVRMTAMLTVNPGLNKAGVEEAC